MSPVYITDIIGEVVAATQTAVLNTIKANETDALGSTLIQGIRYSKSYWKELIETLAQADTSNTERYKKYPIIHLHRDYIEQTRGRLPGVFAEVSLTILFIHQTMNTYKITDRDEKVFRPVLYPIYYAFLEQLEKNGWIQNTPVEMIQHKLDEIPYMGEKPDGTKNKLNDYVDALIVKNLNLKINYTNC